MRKGTVRPARRGRKLYFSILLTYLVFSLAIVIIVLVLAARAYRVLQNDARKMGETVLATVSDEVQDNMLRYVQLCDALSKNEYLDTYATLTRDQVSARGMGAYYLQGAMIKYWFTKAKNIAVYFPNSRSLVTIQRTYTATQLMRYLSQYEGCDEAMLQRMLEKGGYGMQSFGLQQNWVTLSLPGRALIWVEYDITALLGNLQSGNTNTLAMIGDSTGLLWSSATGLGTQQYQDALQAVDAQTLMYLNGTAYLGMRSQIPYSRQTLVIGVPVSDFTANLRAFGLWLVVWLATSVFALGMMAVFFSRRQYSPLESLMQTMEDAASDVSYGKLAEAASQRLLALREENEMMRTSMAQVMPFALGRLLLRLCETHGGHRKSMAEYALNMAEIPCSSGYVMFGVYYMEDTRGLFQDESNNLLRDNRLGLEYFMLNNVLTDLLFAAHPGHIACVEDYYIVLLQAADAQVVADAQRAAGQCGAFYHKTLGTELAVTQPLYGVGTDELEPVFRRTYEEIAHRRFWHNSKENLQRRPGAEQDAYYKSIRNLMSCLDSQNYQEAYAVVQAMLNSGSLPYGEHDLQKAIYRICGMIVTIVSAIDEQNDGFVQHLHLEDRLYRIRDVETFRREAEKLFVELIRHKQETSVQETPRLVREVRRYLQDHYTDPDISVAATAAQFGISESYLTRQFKQYVGCNGLEYIQKLRVEKAKELLRTLTVKTVAQQVGFWDTQALIRVFKKHEGITPGKYKEIVCSQPSAPDADIEN